MKPIYYTKPSITSLEIAYANDAVTNGWGENCYDFILKFEKAFSAYLGVKHAIATSSCTGALTLGISALGLKPGDEVIVGDINWIASIAPIVNLGAKPVFVDILQDTWCIDPDKIESAINSNTKAIVAVHLYGNLAEMAAIRKIAQKHNLALIEDSAEALGSEINGQKAGTFGDFSVFSFHGTKIITTGEGGMFATNDDQLAEKVKTLNNHGRVNGCKKQFWCDFVGYKFKMSNVQAAIGCAQIERFSELLNKKREIFFNYRRLFSELPDIYMNPEKNGTLNSFWMPTIVFGQSWNFDREKLLEELKREKIDGRVFFYPLSSMPMFSPVRENFVSYEIYSKAINLPSYHDLTLEDQNRVFEVVKKFLLKGNDLKWNLKK
jgi:perosamine synthetase